MNDFSYKEFFCSLIGSAILGAALWLLQRMFSAATDVPFNAEAYQRQSQLLNVIIGMAGSVIGYYFGRVPSERLAQSAQSAATKAAADSGAAVQSLNDLRKRVSDVNNQIRSPLGGAGQSNPELLEVARRLDAALE